MRKYSKAITIAISLLVLSFFASHPVFAASDGVVETNLFGAFKDDGTGCGVYMVLNLVLDILTYGVVLAAVIGITISGVTYLTAKGNEQQTTKAKRRILEIVIGLVAYAVLFTAASFLLPGGNLNPSDNCKKLSEEELAAIREEQQKEDHSGGNNSSNSGNNTTPSNSNNNNNNKNKKKEGEPSELGKKILKEMGKPADEFVRIGVTFDNDHCNSSWSELYKKKKSCCSSYVFLTLKRMGLLSKSGDTYFYFRNYGKTISYHGSAKKDLKKNFKVINGNDTIANLVKKGKLVPGDICGDGNYKAHTIMYAGKSGSKYLIHSYGSGKFSKKSHYNVKVSGSYKIGKILHAK